MMIKYPALSRVVEYVLKRGVDLYPTILALCPEHAGYFSKTYDYFLQNMQRLIRSVYEGNLGGDFIGITENLISGQLRQAYEQAWTDEGTGGSIPEYLTESLNAMILDQHGYVPGLYRDIVDARVDGTSLNPLLYRAELWANRWTEAYNEAVHLITLKNGGKEIWVTGETETHCPTCAALNGIVAYASEWEQLGVRPQNAPNDKLACDGWNCDCRRDPTDKRRSPKAFETILNIVTGV